MHQNTGQQSKVQRIRSHIENYGDPYISDIRPGEITVCSDCKSVYTGQRWYLPNQFDKSRLSKQQVKSALCPACRKIRDRSPGGVVTLSGGFLKLHESDIINLIRNEEERALGFNPLERIIDIEYDGASLNVLTTNEKLAQRIGKAIHSAYSGIIEYRWSEDNKLVRVKWIRD